MSELNFPDDLLYHPEHTWLRMEDSNVAVVGITSFAQEQLGEVAYVDLPQVGSQYAVGDEFGVVESIKAANGLYMPVRGKIMAINEMLSAEPSLINTAPYREGWMLRIELEPDADRSHLLSSRDYMSLVDLTSAQ